MDPYEIVHDEAVRALDYQRSALDALRARVGFLLSGATIATSFVGGLALRDEAHAGSWVAIVLFALFAAVALRILWPEAEGGGGYTAIPSNVIDEYLEEPATPTPTTLTTAAVIHRDLALYKESSYEKIERKVVRPLFWYFRLAIILLTAEIVAWVVDLAVR